MAIIKKALIFRLLIAIAIIVLVLLINVPLSTMIILLILTSLLCYFDLFLDIYDGIKTKTVPVDKILVIVATYVSFIASYEFEAAIFAVSYRLAEYIVGLFQMQIHNKLINGISGEEERRLTEDVLSYKNATITKTEKMLRASVSPVLYIIIFLDFIGLLLLPLIGHYNFRVSLHRFCIILYLASSYPLFVSFKTLGTSALCKCAINGVVFNCAESLEELKSNSIILNSYKPDLNSLSDIKASTIIDRDTFLNMIAHVLHYSNQDFALKIKEKLNYPIKPDLISDFNEYEESGISCVINGMNVFFGNNDYLSKLGLNPNSNNPDDYYLYISDREIGNIYTESNVSENDVESIEYISGKVGSIGKANVLFAYIVKAILIALSLAGMTKLWLIILVELISEILLVINSYKL